MAGRTVFFQMIRMGWFWHQAQMSAVPVHRRTNTIMAGDAGLFMVGVCMLRMAIGTLQQRSGFVLITLTTGEDTEKSNEDKSAVHSLKN